MCEVKRYKAMVNTPDGVIVADVYLSEDFDRVQAENQKLQARLTVQDQRVDELEAAINNMLAAFDNPIFRRKFSSEFSMEAIASARSAISYPINESSHD